MAGACWCNTERWAAAGYTPAELYRYYNQIENRIYTAFLGEKSLHYMLIQDGFPRVLINGVDCPQAVHRVLRTDAVTGKRYFDVYSGMPQSFGDVGGGCPNQWAAKEGYRGQIIGYQTVNWVQHPESVDSALWNMMSGSNAAYFELYEEALWAIAKQRGVGSTAAPLDVSVGHYPRQGAAYQKNLSQGVVLILIARGPWRPRPVDP